MTDEDKKDLPEKIKFFEFVTVINKNCNNSNNIWLSDMSSCYLVDINVQYCINNIQLAISNKDDNVIYNKGNGYEDELIFLARSSFEHSRFFNDPILSTNKSSNIYTEWVKSSIGDPNKEFCLYRKNGRTKGFLLYSLNEKTALIELIVVDKQEVRGGIGNALISSLKNKLLNKQIMKIKVGTQMSNITANNFYSKCGFYINEISTVFHVWNRFDNNR